MQLKDLTNITSQNKDFVWFDSANGSGRSLLAYNCDEKLTFNDLNETQRFLEFLNGFKGGGQSGVWAFYLSYEASHYNPQIPMSFENKKDMPLAEFRFYKNVISTPLTESNHHSNEFTIKNLKCNISKLDYKKQFESCLDKIKSGEFFEINLTLPFTADFKGSVLDFYLKLRSDTKAPMMSWFCWEDLQILSASPERFFKTDFKTIDCYPIKGTRKRGIDALSDQNYIQDLEQNTKEKAELLMVTDMIRNDLGRLCQKQGVSVPTLRRCESFPYYHHAISHIHGQLQPGLSFKDLFIALFPGSSITGAPKIQVMKNILALENRARGIYTGALGFIDHNGVLDCNIPIRTLTLKNNKLEFAAGGGLVADSEYEKEWEECFLKASGLIESSLDYDSVDDCLQFHNLIHTP